MQRTITLTLLVIGLTLSGLALTPARAQNAVAVQCGTTVQGEFTKNREDQQYTINVTPGYQVNVNGRAVGETLGFQLSFFGPTWIEIVQQNNKPPSRSPSFKSGVLSARGEHKILAYNRSDYTDGGVGVYTLQIECIDENGRPVTAAPTAAPAVPAAPAAPTAPAATPAFSGVGFPGLPPVDFSEVAKVPLRSARPVNGAITPRGGEILGYTLEARANSTLELSFTREAGNLNLGLVVLSADNKVYFQTSLVTSSALTTTLTLPAAGTYTVGVFRVGLVEPSRPEATAFELLARLR
ncbi:MAG: hypothetical protein HXY37_12575 [Chloroflexi bacterium]|nr:hypothetical protein [Chloroflexota bacterium]